jgi:hypothetical protein
VTIIDALNDADLFGRLPRFRNLGTWSAWIVFLKAVFGLPMDGDEEMRIFPRCTERSDLPHEETREVAAVVGRRGGKSWIAAVIAVFLALLRDWTTHVGTGERVHIVVIAQNMRAAKVVLNYIRGILRSVPAFAAEVIAERSDEIDLRNGITIGVWPCTFRSTRGLTIGAAVCDEVDYWWSESVNAAEEVISAVRPAMATIPGSKLIAISSPYTPTGWLHRFYRDHWRQPGPYLVWKAPSLIMNPTLDSLRVAEAIAEDPERGQAEWQAEWRQGIAAFLDPALVDACARSDPLVIPPRVEVVAG